MVDDVRSRLMIPDDEIVAWQEKNLVPWLRRHRDAAQQHAHQLFAVGGVVAVATILLYPPAALGAIPWFVGAIVRRREAQRYADQLADFEPAPARIVR